MPVQRLISDNGPAFRPHGFSRICIEPGIKQKLTRACRSQTNAKTGRLIQSALREWACGHSGPNSDESDAALTHWTHCYNWHRPHHGTALRSSS